MADFIAVIRRAVDGLSENTPEMRAKVYERAKSAVVRQLENMKPRPPEVMFQRQLDKLDAAIREVESEHSDALPDDDAPAAVAAVEPEAVPAAVAREPVAAEIVAPEPPQPAPEPVKAVEPEPAAVVRREIIPETAFRPLAQPNRDAPADKAPVVEPVVEPVAEAAIEPVRVAEPPSVDEPKPVIPEYVTSEAAVEEPVARLEPEAHPAQIDVKSYEDAPEVSAKDDEIAYEPEQAEAYVAQAESVYQPFAAAEIKVESPIEVKPAAVEEAKVAQPEPAAEEPAPPMPKVSYDENDVVAGFNDFLKEELNRKVVPPPPAKAKKSDDFSWDAPFDDLPEIRKPEAFEKALEAKQKEIAAGAEKRKGRQQKAEPASARAELEDLIGIEPAQRRPAQTAADASGLPPEISRAVSKLEGKSFKMQKKGKKTRRGFRMLPVVLGVIGALVVGGGAYALWHYKEDVSQLVASIMPAGEAKKPVDVAKTDVKSETRSPAVKTETKSETTEVKQPAKETEVASLNPDIGPQKFTQRLLPDGTEADTDTATVPIDQALPEGKSVAGQTEKGKEVAETTATDAKTDATKTGQPVQNDAQPLGATQKMFLYEERLGQTSPVAVPGTVVWREKTETDDDKPDPTIEASLDIPERKITALISIKRNTDPSLPASHIIEIVFNLPKDFEEGNVDSIQRVAFKQTEQDRGNPLIAVPAKITDDFHMVALNDEADARKVNLELMKTRSWIDIPITYRNGRRALITLEKGATGTAVFDKVMGEWDALGAQSSNNNNN